MRKEIYGLALGALLFAFTFPAQGQLPAKKVYRIAILSPATQPRPVIEALRQGLRDRGYTEGQNIVFDARYAEWKLERLPQLASELVKLNSELEEMNRW